MVTFRLANSRDYENINSFYNRIYKSNRTLEQFLWEFENGPFGKAIYVIAEDNGKIVGTNCVIPINLITSEKKIIRSGKSEDTLVDPDYRGQSIFYKIYDYLFEKCKEENIQLIWGFTSAKKPFRNLGFDTPYEHQQSLAVNQIGTSFKYLSSLNLNNKIKDKFKILGLCFISKLKFILDLNSKKTNYTIEKTEKVLNGIDELIYENQKNIEASFVIHQTPDFQEWRIYSNPNYFKTHTYKVHLNNKLKALIVFNSHPNKVAYICQTSFHPDLNDTEKTQILKNVIKMLFKEGIALIRNWHFNTNNINRNEIKIYQKAGFILINRGISLVWKELDKTALNSENFILSRIATQGVI